MEVETYRAIFAGKIETAINREQAKTNLAQFFKTDQEKIERLYSGKRFVLKDGMTLEEAQHYRQGFEKTGNLCTIETVTKPQTQSTPPPKKKTENPIYEVRYKVVFKGELKQGFERETVADNLGRVFQIERQKVLGLFTGEWKPITGPVDFWTAIDYVKRFQACGAITDIRLVEPTVTAVPTTVEGSPKETAAVTTTGGQQNSDSPDTAKQERKRIRAESKSIYEDLATTYRFVLKEFNLEKRYKKTENSERGLGCIFLVMIGAVVSMVIWSPLRWYWGLASVIGIFGLMGALFRNWDTRYADVFLGRLEWVKKKNPALFIVTLNKWVNDLPSKDRAKFYLQKKVSEIIRENMTMKEALGKYAEVIGPLIQSTDVVPGEPGDVPDTNRHVKHKIKQEPGMISCPRCRSQDVRSDIRGTGWAAGAVTSIFLGPFLGAMVASIGEEEPIYVCGACKNKWKRKTRRRKS